MFGFILAEASASAVRGCAVAVVALAGYAAAVRLRRSFSGRDDWLAGGELSPSTLEAFAGLDSADAYRALGTSALDLVGARHLARHL